VRRLAPALALAAVLVLAAPALAQDRGAPVVGGGSFNSAPILDPGRFHDTILPGEYLYYGFRVAAGQRLRVELTHPDIENADVRDLGVIYLSGNIHTPTRTVGFGATTGGDNAFISFGDFETKPLIVTSGEAEAAEDDGKDGVWKSAGVYYLALHAVWSGNGTRPKAEIPFTFAAELLGTALPNATPSATPTPTATPTAKAAPAPEPAEDDGPGPAVAAIGGVGGILLGAVAGVARRGRRR
jgi:Ca-activated chloride channel homolog